ncbi:MAG: hypothetical protein AAB676_09830 [Verrucomicrobiota bacterium]
MNVSLARIEKQRRTFRATAKQIGNASAGVRNLLQNCYEFRKETKWQLNATCNFSPFPKGTTARILKAVIKRLNEVFVRFLLWIQFPFTH